jgi:flagellin-like protein
MKRDYRDAMIKKMRSKQAVSEVIGVVLLLGITISLFALLNFYVFNFSFEPSVTTVNLVGTIDKGKEWDNITIEHYGGESLDGKTQIIITIGSNTTPIRRNASDLLNDINNDNKWNFGETVEFPNHTKGKYIQALVVDPSANKIILSVELQQELS